MLELNLSLNTNANIQANGYDPNGKYYARVETKKTYSLRELAKHMHDHYTAFSPGLIVGVLTDMVACIKELVLEGNVVKIDDLGLFKASVEANGLTLQTGARISAGIGTQRTDAELQADITRQQMAIDCVKLIMQATGETTKDEMTGDVKLAFTKYARELIKSKTGNESTDNSGSDNSGSTTGGTTGGNTGGDNGGGDNGGDDDPVINDH